MRVTTARLPGWLAACCSLVLLASCSDNTSGSGSGRYQSTLRPSASGSVPESASASGPRSSAPAGPSTAGSSGAPSKSTDSGAHPAPAHPVRTASVVGSDGTTYVIKVWADTKVTDCPAHAYGTPVIDYLKAHPCTGMEQLLATTTVNGKDVGFAQRSIGFSGSDPGVYKTAGKFRALVSQNGTGNLNDLLREGYRLPSGPTSVPFPNAFSALAQDNSVTVLEAWYLKGATPDNDPALEKMARDIYLQF